MKTFRNLGIFAVVMGLLAGCTTAPSAQQEAAPEASSTETVASQDKTLTIHYLRYDENYEPWNLWLWAEGSEGSVYEFTE